jgi:serine/threonine protein kinase
MTGHLAPDEELIRRLPLPLAQLYRRAHDAKTPLERHMMAYYLWQASLELLGSVAIVAYAERSEHDPALAERLISLARPAVGNWWEYVRLLIPTLADAGEESFRGIRDLVLGSSRSNLPRAAALDTALRECLGGPAGAHSVVRVSELFERLVRYRNRFIGHGVVGAQAPDFYERMGEAILAGVGDLLGSLDVLAGRRLDYVVSVQRRENGAWGIERLDLTGETARPLKALERPAWDASRLPLPNRVYLDSPARGDSENEPASAEEPPGTGRSPSPVVVALRSLHPLVIYVPESEEMFFLSARRGRSRIEYLGYISGAFRERPDLGVEHRDLLARVLGSSVTGDQVAAWADRSVADEAQGAPSPAADEPPLRRLGEFELLSVLGRGGMGRVYRAWQPSLGRQVALKCLLRVGDAKAEARFDREIHALGKVEHSSVVKVFTSGVDGDQWFYAMELVEGATLAALCRALQTKSASAAGLDMTTWRESLSKACEDSRKEEKSLSDPQLTAAKPAPPRAEIEHPSLEAASLPRQGYVKQIAELVRQVALGAHALHQAGVVHRDIKPGNIVVTADGSQAVLMDLGLAQLADESDNKNNRNLTTKFVGTLRYASPEQILDSAKVDRRTDVYSLGAVLWELLTLRPLYGASDSTPDFQLQRQIVLDEPKRVRAYHPGIARDLEAIVAKCLEKQPDQRYTTAADLADDLRRFLASEPVKARPVGPIGRTARWARRRPLRAAAVALGCVLLSASLGAGYAYWDFRRERIEYYSGFENRWGIPVGIGRLSADQARRRQQTMEFHRRAGRLERVDIVNGNAHLTAQHGLATYVGSRDDTTEAKRECSWVYRYDEKGQLAEEKALDLYGKIVWRFVYIAPDTARYFDERGSTFSVRGSEANLVRFERSERGLDKEIKYYDSNGNQRRPNRDGIYGIRREFDARGWPVREAFLGSQDQPMLSKDGYAASSTKFDERGNRTEVAFFDEAGQPTRHKDGYASTSAEYDGPGNPVVITCFDESGRPTPCNGGFAKITVKYDDRGNQTGAVFRGVDGKPAWHKDGFAGLSFKCDDGGYLVEESFLDESGKPVRINNGYARLKAKYDNRGNRTEEAFFDESGQPVRHKNGYATVTMSYDDRGNQTEVAYFGCDGKATRHKDGYAKVGIKYDGHSQAIEIRYFDDVGRPTWHNDGYASFTNNYDERGHLIEQSNFDEVGKLVRIKDGYARLRAKNDERGNAIDKTYFDESDQPTRVKDGFAKLTSTYDRKGNLTSQAFFGIDGEPTLHKDGYAMFTTKFDERRQPIETNYFDEMRRPTRHNDGNERITIGYDEHGNCIERAYFAADGSPVRNLDGYHKLKAVYDNRGNEIEQTFFDESGEPVRVGYGYAKFTAQYDFWGNRTEQAYFGRDGKPARHSDGQHRVTAKYDDRGNQVERAFFDESGRPVRLHAGYAKVLTDYNERGYAIAIAVFGPDGRPTTDADGHARWTNRFDERGNRIEQAYFGLDGGPARHPDGYAKVTDKHDSRSNPIEEAYFDESGKPTRHKDGYAKFAAKYDASNNVIEYVYFDASGKPTRRKDGFAKVTYKYDSSGNQTDASFFDPEGKPVRCRVVISEITSGGPGERIGLKVGDILMTYDKQEVINFSSFRLGRLAERPGEKLKELVVVRKGKSLTLLVPPGPLQVSMEDRVVPEKDLRPQPSARGP